jgi:UDPglucose 6-dehydrogenase
MAAGAIVTAHDPAAAENAARKLPELRCAASAPAAARDAELVLHLTEWPEYQAIDPAALRKTVARSVAIDARCALKAAQWRDAGWTVHVLGRPSHEPSQERQGPSAG